MIRAKGVVAIAAMAAALVAGAGAAAAEQGTTSVIVVLDHDTATAPGGFDAAAARLASAHGGRAARVFSSVLGGFQFEGPAAAVQGLANEPGVTAVVADETVELVDVAGTGFFRIDAEQSVNDPNGPYRGLGARVAVIDSGVDPNHPDLTPNLDKTHWFDCVENDALPQDDNGHGTHVAGIAAAAFNANGSGIVGVAPSASLLPIKAFDGSGNGETSWILCALNRLAAVTSASPMPTALNMSFEDAGTDSACNDAVVTDVLHEALCDVVEAGQSAGVPVVPVAAAGNSDTSATQNIPAAFSDVITVSALADHDGAAGGAAGCEFITSTFNYECDDTLASFTNWGTSIDVAAPGVDIYSDVPGGGQDYLSGTSMAAPHVTGVVALVLAEHATLDTAGVRSLLTQTGECPNGTTAGADASCAGQGQWQQTVSDFFAPPTTEADPDGIPEPLVNAARAASAADAAGDPPPPPPSDQSPQVAVTSPTSGQNVSGTINVSGTSSDDHGVVSVEVLVDGVSVGSTTPGAGGAWSVPWNTTTATNGGHSVTARAVDTAAHATTSAPVAVTVANATSTVMHVGELAGSATGTRKWTATATIRVVDAGGLAVSGATVQVSYGASTASLSAPGGGGGKPPPSGSGVLSCVTAADGRCSVSTKPSGTSVRFTVTNVTRTGWTYDAGASVDGDPSTTAIDITVVRPA